MKNFGEVTKEILRYGFDDGPQVNKARIEDWINEAQLQIARTIEEPVFQESATITMVVGKQGYAVPASFLRAETLFYPKASLRLKPVDLQTFDSMGQEIEGQPVMYTLFKAEILLFPTPNIPDNLTLRYLKKPPRLVAEGDIPVLPEDYLHLLVEYGLYRAYRAEDDLEAAAQHETQYKQDLAVLAQDTGFEDSPKQLRGTWRS